MLSVNLAAMKVPNTTASTFATLMVFIIEVTDDVRNALRRRDSENEIGELIVMKKLFISLFILSCFSAAHSR